MFETQYIPLKRRVEIFRRHAEVLFSTAGLECSLCISQRLDVLIQYLVLLRRGNFYCGNKKWRGKRKMRDETSVAS